MTVLWPTMVPPQTPPEDDLQRTCQGCSQTWALTPLTTREPAAPVPQRWQMSLPLGGAVVGAAVVGPAVGAAVGAAVVGAAVGAAVVGAAVVALPS